MGSTVSPNGQFLAATSTDKSVALQIFDLQSYKLLWSVGTAAGVSQKFSNGTVGQEGPTYSPNGKVLWLPQQTGLTRFPVNKDGTLGTPTTVTIPTVSGHAALVGQIKYSPDKAIAVRGDQRPEHRRGARSQHGRDPAHLERRHRAA